VKRKRKERGAWSAAGTFLRWWRCEAGEGVGLGKAVGGRHQPGPTDKRWAADASPAVVRSVPRQGREGALMGGPHATVQGGTVESRQLMCGLHNTVLVD
jgi:hypothetical protein